MRQCFLEAVFVFMIVMLAGCTTPKVDRIEPDTVTDLSGGWNDTDSRLVAAEMIEEALSLPWLSHFTAANPARKPAVIVGEITNLSDEHINVNALVADIERALINSGRVDMLASRYERQEVRDERQDQEVNASAATRKPGGQEQGADFMLQGTVNTIVDAVRKQQTRFYQVDLVLISLADNRKVWAAQKQIKKAIKRPLMRY